PFAGGVGLRRLRQCGELRQRIVAEIGGAIECQRVERAITLVFIERETRENFLPCRLRLLAVAACVARQGDHQRGARACVVRQLRRLRQQRGRRTQRRRETACGVTLLRRQPRRGLLDGRGGLGFHG